MSSTSIFDLTDHIREEALNESNGPQGGQSHARLLQLVDELKLAVETPTETILRLIYQVCTPRDNDLSQNSSNKPAKPPENAALRTVVDLDVFPILMSSESKEGTSATEIAKLTGADRGLISKLQCVDRSWNIDSRHAIVRLMRVMASLGLCTSTEPEVYRATEKTASMTQPIGRDGVPCM
jgi:hypothetical protein